MKTEHNSTKQKISVEDGKRKHSYKLKLSEKSDNDSVLDNQAQLSEKKIPKDKYSLSKKKKKQKKSAVRSKKNWHETSFSPSSEDSDSDSDSKYVVKKKKSQE